MCQVTCPSPAELSAFVLGKLRLPELDRVARHLDICADCEAAVESLECMSDPVLAAIRHSGVGTKVLSSDSVTIDGPPVPEALGDFRIIREIGRGGMGVVYEAEQLSLGRRVALKILARHALLEPESLERFRRESRAVAGLHHTNIVQVFGTGEQNGLHYFVMQLIHGVGLDRVLGELRGGEVGQASSTTSRERAGPASSLEAAVCGLLSGTLSGSRAQEVRRRPQQQFARSERATQGADFRQRLGAPLLGRTGPHWHPGGRGARARARLWRSPSRHQAVEPASR